LVAEHGQKGINLRRTHGAWVLHLPTATMPADEKSHPVEAILLSAEAIVHVPQALTQLVQQLGCLQWWCAGVHEEFIPGYLSNMSACKLVYKPLSEESVTRLIRSGQNILQVLPWTLRWPSQSMRCTLVRKKGD
jgi:hypothetical protein